MAFIARHKRYLFSLIVCGIISCIVLFDFDGQNKIERYNPSGIVHYNLPYDVFPPSPYLFKRTFLNSIADFPDRDTVVLIGNSVVAGVGAKNSLHFNSLLNEDFNVINAGLRGELLGASSALAVLAINENITKHPKALHHIFVAYAPSYMYFGTYWATGAALSSLAEENNLASYIAPYKNIAPREGIRQILENAITINMRCIFNRRVVVNAVNNHGLHCEKPFEIESTNPGFLKIYNRLARTSNELADLSKFVSDTLFIDTQSGRDIQLRDLTANIAPMEQFLVSKGVNYKMYFLLLPESAEGIDTLPARRRDEYYLGRKVFLEQLAQRKPDWKIIEAPLMENGDFFADSAHLRESGQTKLASLIKQQLARDRIMRQ